MSVSSLEALSDAIALVNGINDPSSEAYQTRNPGLLRSFSLARPQSTNERGVRIFTSLVGGYRALLNDLEKKCSGQSRASVFKNGKPEKLSRESTLRDLFKTFGVKIDGPVLKAASFLRVALGKEDISPNTPLAFFLEENK